MKDFHCVEGAGDLSTPISAIGGNSWTCEQDCRLANACVEFIYNMDPEAVNPCIQNNETSSAHDPLMPTFTCDRSEYDSEHQFEIV